MSTARARRLRLREIMRLRKLTPAGVGEILGRSDSLVRGWRAGLHPMPVPMLRLLELELKQR